MVRTRHRATASSLSVGSGLPSRAWTKKLSRKLTAARHLVDLAPYRESAHARVMECHLAAGNRAEAVRTYTDLRAMLAETMGLAPNEATERLYLDALG